jgi:hypothetical protein
VDQQVTDRRAETRVVLFAAGVRATLRPGCSVCVVDLSAGGALVQGGRPLRPGARVHVHVMTAAGTFTVTARVLRCAVWALHPTDGATYRGALQFDTRWESFQELAGQPGSRIPDASPPHSGRVGHPTPGTSHRRDIPGGK